jgi:hypothetical protein
MSLGHIGHPCPAMTQNAIEQVRRSAIYGGTKTVAFVSPFEKNLLTQLHLELKQYILQYTKNVLS